VTGTALKLLIAGAEEDSAKKRFERKLEMYIHEKMRKRPYLDGGGKYCW